MGRLLAMEMLMFWFFTIVLFCIIDLSTILKCNPGAM